MGVGGDLAHKELTNDGSAATDENDLGKHSRKTNSSLK
jgi:hypothetical protein